MIYCIGSRSVKNRGTKWPCHTIAYRISVCQRMENFNRKLAYARGTLGIGCMRFKHGRHTDACIRLACEQALKLN
jgi:hypothetical protein